MRYAAKFYVQVKKLTDTDLFLAAASVTGESPAVEEWFVLD